MSETMEVNRAAFGQFLNQLRREKGWTQKDLAERLYVSDKAVSKWERGLSLPEWPYCCRWQGHWACR